MTISIILLVVAFGAVMLEIGVPSFGILSLVATGSYAFSLVYAFREGSAEGWAIVAAGVLLLPVAVLFGSRLLPHTPMGRAMMLRSPKREDVEVALRGDDREKLLGSSGVALSDLRPSGACDFEGRRTDVVTTGGFVSRGAKVRVVRVDGMRVVVEPEATDPNEKETV